MHYINLILFGIALASSSNVENSIIVQNDTQEELLAIAEILPIQPYYNLTKDTLNTIPTVPFYSQFNDISNTEWQKKACGITSLAMLIELYKPGEISVDALLNEGIQSGAYLNNAGWVHRDLALLANKHGLYGNSFDYAESSMETAYTKLENSLRAGPVIVSIHYMFDPKSTIPHLAVINGINDGQVYYNDPATDVGGKSLSVDKFIKAWKKRYIEIRPTT